MFSNKKDIKVNEVLVDRLKNRLKYDLNIFGFTKLCEEDIYIIKSLGEDYIYLSVGMNIGKRTINNIISDLDCI